MKGLLGGQVGKVQKVTGLVHHAESLDRSLLMDIKLGDDVIVFLLRTGDLRVGEEMRSIIELF